MGAVNILLQRERMPPKDEFTQSELEMVMSVFKQYETGLREACIDVKDLHIALVSLGLNILEQEVIDMTNTVARNGLVFFAEVMFKMICGTDPLPELYRAKKYKIHQKFLAKAEFQFIMRNLPVAVTEDDIEDMFKTADTDGDGKIGYKEFQQMINPPKPPEGPRPTKALFKSLYQELSEQAKDIPTKAMAEEIQLKPTPKIVLDEDNLSMCMNNSVTSNKVVAVKSVNFVSNI